MSVSITEAPDKDFASALMNFIVGESDESPLEGCLPKGTRKDIIKTIRIASRCAMRDSRYSSYSGASTRLGISMEIIKNLPINDSVDTKEHKPVSAGPWQTESAKLINKQLSKLGLCSSTPHFYIDIKNEKAADYRKRIEKAREVCSECAVLIPCAEYSILYEEPFGVFAGATERGRNNITSSIVELLKISIGDLRDALPESEVRIKLRREILPPLIEQEHKRTLGNQTFERDGSC